MAVSSKPWKLIREISHLIRNPSNTSNSWSVNKNRKMKFVNQKLGSRKQRAIRKTCKAKNGKYNCENNREIEKRKVKPVKQKSGNRKPSEKLSWSKNQGNKYWEAMYYWSSIWEIKSKNSKLTHMFWGLRQISQPVISRFHPFPCTNHFPM